MSRQSQLVAPFTWRSKGSLLTSWRIRWPGRSGHAGCSYCFLLRWSFSAVGQVAISDKDV